MLYENYQNKILKIARYAAKVVKLLPLIIGCFAVVVAAAGTLLATKGIVSPTTCPALISYGETPICQSKAFLSDVSFEYRADGSDVWSAEVPKFPGVYYVRGVSKGSFGGARYGDETQFTIAPKTVEVNVVQSSIVYGEKVSASAVLVGGDSLSCDSFTFADILLETTEVWANKESIVITDRNGNDVTHAYDIQTPKKEIAILQRALSVTVSDASQEYDNTRFSYDQYEISGGTLVEGDTLQATFDQYLIDVGSVENTPTLKVINSNGADVTHHYAISESIGKLTVDKRPLVITVADLSVTYNGKEHSCQDYTIDENSSLVAGHRLEIVSFSKATDAGEYKNDLAFKIVDGEGNDKTSNYSLFVASGKISIAKAEISVATASDKWEYDGYTHAVALYYVYGKLMEGHDANPDNNSPMTIMEDVGVKENIFSIVIFDGEAYAENSIDVTKNYNISYTYGTLEVTKRPITVETSSDKWVYDGQPHSNNGYFISSNPGLVMGQYLTVIQSTTITDAGVAENKLEKFVILDADGNNKSGNYDVSFKHGRLEVTKRPITVKPMDVSKAYDGTPLNGGEIELSEGSKYELAEGHTMTAETVGSRTEVGISKSTLKNVAIKDGGTDVTGNYDITVETGEIEITKPEKLPVLDPNGEEESAEPEMQPGFNFMKNKPHNDGGECPPVALIKSDTTGKVYLRETSYGRYTGSGWSPIDAYPKLLPSGYNYNYLTSIALKNAGASISFAEIRDSQTYMLPYYIGFEGDYSLPKSDTLYSSNKTSYGMSYYSLGKYMDNINALKGNLGAFASYEKEYAQFVRVNYTQISNSTKSYMRQIIKEQGFKETDPDIIEKVATYIQGSAKYNLGYNAALDLEKDVVVAFLDQYKEGICVHYASAATMLYRAMGIPARFAVGYTVDTIAGQEVIVSCMGAHAWVEVYVDGIGWIEVEVTGGGAGAGASGLDPSGGIPEGGEMEGEFGGEHGEGGDVKQDFNSRRIVVYPSYQYKKYDGMVLIANDAIDPDINLSRLIEKGYTYTVKLIGTRTKVGRSISKVSSFSLFDPSGNDVTSQYVIEYKTGILEVFPADTKIMSVYLYQLQKYYDGSALSFNNDDYEIIKNEGNGKIDLEIDISLTDAGGVTLAEINEQQSNYVSYKIYDTEGKDVTSEYAVVFEKFPQTAASYIPIMVCPRPIELTTATDSKLYDGTPLENTNVSLTKGPLVHGHRLEAVAAGSIEFVGEAPNVLIDCAIYDAEGNNVSHNYEVKVNVGTLTIIDPNA